MAKVRRYKSSRKYRCPYCGITATREKLISHIDNKHEDMIPEGYTSARVLYDYINKKNYGTCLICKRKVYEWDNNIARYKNICNDPACMKQLKQRAQGNHLDDPEVQKKMLANRKISGTYTFQDGVTHSYVGSYERNCFEFMDTVMNIPGKDIMSPGPTIYYTWNGSLHPWILDWMYIPAMLCCDVKDGGSNPNNRPMEEYRAKQLAKEEAIRKSGKYNYIRLTDNNFAQLLQAFSDIRYGVINNDPLNHIYINEDIKLDYDETMANILDLNKRLNGYKYSYKDYNNFAKEYRVANPKQFEKQEGGVCWDFAAYEAWWFKKNYPSIPFTTWYVIFDNNNDCPTHTFLTFRYKGKVYYFESAFGKTMGVWQVKSEKDAINFVMDSMIGKTKLGEYPYYIIKYDASDKKLIGVGVVSYMERMSELIEKSTYRHTFSKQYSVDKVSLKSINETFYEAYSDEIDDNLISFDHNTMHIEAVGGIPSHRGSGHDYIIPHMMNNVFDGGKLVFGNTSYDRLIQFSYDINEPPKLIEKDDNNLASFAEDYRIILPSNKIPSISIDQLSILGEDGLISYLTNRPYTGLKNLLMEVKVKISSDCESDLIRQLILNGTVSGIRSAILESNSILEDMANGFIESRKNVTVYKDDEGYYLITPSDFRLVSNHYASYDSIPSNLFDLMNDMYEGHKERGNHNAVQQ